ncbi:MAG: M14 metallopeptidase family protein [Longimicrobiales bacterium]
MLSRVLTVASGLLVSVAGPLQAQAVPTPESHFGFELGADRKLANWSALTSYYARLAESSARVKVDTLGPTTAGLPFVMLTITSPENHADIDRLHEIQMRLADPRRVGGEEELERLLDEGKTVVLITHAIHSTEVGGAQTAARLAYRMASSNEPRILEILDNVILLDIPSLNPDGTQWVVNWYNEHVGTEYEAAPMPWLYHYYTGHDNNRDWYAFTQLETQHTVLKAHNAWHPQIVHDIHQMGDGGARIFFPPYIDPIEHNVDPGLVSAVNMLGTYMAAELTVQGKKGVVVGAIYDGFTPARAYQHYHGGARILSETASARLATPITLTADDIGGGREYDAAVATWNFPNPWEGGEWGLPDIVDYMESGAVALLTNAAKNRRYWLESFYRINLRAVKGWESWPTAWVIPADQGNPTGLAYVLRILRMGDVEVHRARADFRADGRNFPAGSFVVPMNQPYAGFAQTMLEVQHYPDLRQFPGGPPKAPYDVTAHTLPLLMDVDAVAVDEAGDLFEALDPESIETPRLMFSLPEALLGPDAPRVAIYKSAQEPMDAGWTRWVFDQHGLRYDTLKDARVREGGLSGDYDVILLQNQSAVSISEGYARGEVPPEYVGGLGPSGVSALESFVRGGGRLVAIDEATDFVIDLFDLDVANAVERLESQDFYIPGSILQVDLEDHPITEGMGPQTPVWYWRSSRAFDVMDPRARVVARYAEGNPVLSGWILGPEHVAGKPAIVEATVGAGSVVLFGFQPNYRAQTVATWPLLWNALSASVETPTRGGLGERDR